MIRNNEIRLAVQRALTTSAIAAGSMAVLPAHAQQAPAVNAAATDQPQEVIVTGTRVRRVDTETANPVLTIDNRQIQNTGAQTIGELIMQLPTVNGSATNPSVNNGGGFGESYIELRGLDAKRTLITAQDLNGVLGMLRNTRLPPSRTPAYSRPDSTRAK